MAIDLNIPQNLMQYKSFQQVALTGDRRFVFKFNEYDEGFYNLRVIKNSRIVPEDEYSLNITSDEIIVIFNNYANSGDIIHLDVFIPLNRYNEYSVCIIDYTTMCSESVNIYPIKYEFYNPGTCKFQIIHSRLGFISKEKYNIRNNEYIVFNDDISFIDGDILYVKVIQDGAKLLRSPYRLVVKTQPNKTSYYEGESFETTGMELELVSNTGNDKIAVNVSDVIVTPSVLTVDTKSVVVKYVYEGITYETNVAIDVTVEAVTYSLVVKTQPNKTSYYEGESFETTGMVLELVPNKGDNKITVNVSDVTVTPSILTTDTRSVVVKYVYEGIPYETNVNITVKNVTYSLVVKTQPSRTSYYEGESFDTAGMELELVPNVGTDNIIVSVSDVTVIPSKLTVDTESVVVKYTYQGINYETSISVTVENVDYRLVVKSQPSKTSYYEGESFETTGMVLELVPNVGNDKIAVNVSDVTVTPSKLTTSTKSVVVKYVYQGIPYETNVNITVKNVTYSLVVKSQPSKTSYYEGESFETTGMVLELVPNVGNDKIAVNVSDVTVTPSKLTTSTKSVVVKYVYQGVTYETNVDVNVTVEEYSLVDFTFTDNGNNTYTLTGWKGTLNGVRSTELVIPNSSEIIL